MKIRNKELKALKSEELSSKLNELKADLMKARTEASRGGMMKNPRQIRSIKRTIAKLLTVKNFHEINKTETAAKTGIGERKI